MSSSLPPPASPSAATSPPAAPTDGPPAAPTVIPPPAVARRTLARRGQWLEVLTIGWNLVESLVSIVAGWLAGSIALVGFGVDSLIEVSSGTVLLWRLGHDHGAGRERAEALAVRLVGVCFLLLAGYVAWEAGGALWRHEPPEATWTGIAIATLSLVVMPLLARAKRRVSVGLESAAMQADARQTDLCAYLSAILLGGLALNAVLGWWWADPVAALLMVPIILREGVLSLRGQSCGGCCATA